jgi:hypothetical protein
LAFHHSAFRKASTPEMLKSMKMSKSGKATECIAASKPEEREPAASPPTALIGRSLEYPLSSGSQRISSALSQLAAAAPASPMSWSMLPQLTSSSNVSSAVSALEQQQHEVMLLQLLSEQRNRDLLSLTSVSSGLRGSSLPVVEASSTTATANFHRALLANRQQQAAVQEQQQQQLLFLLRARVAGQELLRTQQQGQQAQQQLQPTGAAIQMALMALKSRQENHSTL